MANSQPKIGGPEKGRRKDKVELDNKLAAEHLVGKSQDLPKHSVRQSKRSSIVVDARNMEASFVVRKSMPAS